jgi:fatty-acyl-CoA synthase
MVDGRMNTGDLGHLDAAGRLFVDGREDDMIVSGGENVFPQEVADEIATHPAVADVAVFGVEDPDFGQRLRAYVVAGPATALTTEDLLAHLRARIARYKIPRDVVFLDEIPRNPTGKIQRALLPEA